MKIRWKSIPNRRLGGHKLVSFNGNQKEASADVGKWERKKRLGGRLESWAGPDLYKAFVNQTS